MVVDVNLKNYEEFKKVQSNYRNYIVLDSKELQFQEDTNKFKKAIDVLDLVNTIHWANDFYKQANSCKTIPLEILYKCMDASFSNKPFSDDELIEYYKTMVLFEDFVTSIIKFKEIDCYLSYDLEFVLFGLTFEENEKLTEKQKEEFHELYGDLYCDMRLRKLEVDVFISKVKTMIEKLKRTISKDLNLVA